MTTLPSIGELLQSPTNSLSAEHQSICPYHGIKLPTRRKPPPTLKPLPNIFTHTFMDQTLYIGIEYLPIPPLDSSQKPRSFSQLEARLQSPRPPFRHWYKCYLCRTPMHVLNVPLDMHRNRRTKTPDIPMRPLVHLYMAKLGPFQWKTFRHNPALFKLNMETVELRILLESFVRCASCGKNFGLLDCLGTFVDHKASGECDKLG